MKCSVLYKLSYTYLCLHLFLFLITWLDFGVGLVLAILFGSGFYKLYKNIDDNEVIVIDKKAWGIIFLIAGLWCFLGGIGYFYYQSFDYHFRNAVFRDLINYDWTVFYDRANTPLVYYMGFWLVPALVGKFLVLIGATNQGAFLGANVFLLMYAIFGVVLIFVNLIKAVGVKSLGKIFVALLLFVLFSGMDIVGQKFFLVGKPPFLYHLDWWASFMQYSSHSTSMFWVFNQFIPACLIVLIFYNERNIKSFGFLVAVSLFFAPYPTAGIGFFMVVYALREFLRAESKKEFLEKNIFSVVNLIGVFWILPVIILYFITNSEGMYGYYNVFDYTSVKMLMVFLLLEFLIYAILILPKYKNNWIFYAVVISLCLIPFLRLDQQNNFCMRSSIPIMIILTVLIEKFIFEEKFSIRKGILVFCIIIGMFTPFYEFYRGFHYVIEAKKLNLVADEIYTLNNKFIRMPLFFYDVNHQFTAKEYKEDLFWQFLAKKTKGLNTN